MGTGLERKPWHGEVCSVHILVIFHAYFAGKVNRICRGEKEEKIRKEGGRDRGKEGGR
jgi:hypothetical protein